MDNLGDPGNNVKVSDSAYSNSSNTSQSRRSRSSKSTHSGSNSSGSSGYGGKPSTSSSNTDQLAKKEKDAKKKKQTQVEKLISDSKNKGECRHQEMIATLPVEESENKNVLQATSPENYQADSGAENMDVSVPEQSDNVNGEGDICDVPSTKTAVIHPIVSNPATSCNDGFSCVISMHDGVVMYTTSSITSILGFPKEMWIGRSFIDFVHPRDRHTFASQITSGLAVPKVMHNTQEKVVAAGTQSSTLVCRIRKYRGLKSGFNVKDKAVSYIPFLLKFTFKGISNHEGNNIYLVIQMTPYCSAFKTSNEVLAKVVPFVMRHNSNGNLEYIDPESVPYLGYLPQDIINKDALQLYHPDDLEYLYQVYETIVKDGCLTCSNPYRMMAQNGHYIKVETEWSAFINPWSKKLEFVNGKHKVVEGPLNPDIFQLPNQKPGMQFTDEEKNKADMYRDGIIRILNEVLTKPAEVAKQQMTKRCQELASYMETLMEEQPKAEDELRLEIHEADYNYFERDSVMLGGISPHHDYNDSKSSIETPLSYNQLNYNENLQRYFNSHLVNDITAVNTVTAENTLARPETNSSISNRPCPMVFKLEESEVLTGSGRLTTTGVSDRTGDSSTRVEMYPQLRLTESLLSKHNVEMEKELLKIHRESRSNNKGDREKVGIEVRQKKKEHLARCNASFQSPPAESNTTENINKKGVKRSSKQLDLETNEYKLHCNADRQTRRKVTTTANLEFSPIVTSSFGSPWQANSISNVNSYIFGMGISPQMSIMSPVPPLAGLYPMYYTPTSALNTSTAETVPPDLTILNNTNSQQFPPPPVPCMMYGQPAHGSPFLYSQMNPPGSYFQQTLMSHTLQYNNVLNPLCLTKSNYEERTTCESSTATDTKPIRKSNGDETVDRTDGESSFSSFYSSFFKTESGSNEESNDPNKTSSADNSNKNPMPAPKTLNRRGQIKAPKRKIEPPWMEQVCATSEFMFKYQVTPKTLEEVLSSDKKKIRTIEQPSLVNEQLGQLYLDLQLEGVAARLTLEEGITSSGSSVDDTSTTSKGAYKKTEYSKLVMIYEENAPLPSPPSATASASENPVP